MEELRTKHKSLQNAAHHIALECIHPQVPPAATSIRIITKAPTYSNLYISDVIVPCFSEDVYETTLDSPLQLSHGKIWFVVACLCSDHLGQSTHGSPYHVHPYPSPVRLQHAFQAHHSPKMFHPKGLKPHLEMGRGGYAGTMTPSDSPILGRALCLTPRGSPQPGRVSHLSDRLADSLTLSADTDALLANISAMFPTVSETHIKILLKKYYNREAVVISALQVEKHPITTPGPRAQSPGPRGLRGAATGVCSALHLARGAGAHGGASSSLHGSAHFTPLTASPHGSPMLHYRPASGASSYYGTNKSYDGQLPRHHSPKMKLKYLKSIYQMAEETLILDVLANKDNNVQKAGEELLRMGFARKEPPVRRRDVTPPPAPQPSTHKPLTIFKTQEEKNRLKEKLQKKYSSIAERVITIALESVDYNEDRVEQMLSAVLLEDEAPKAKAPEAHEPRRPSVFNTITGAGDSPPAPPAAPAPPATRRLKTWTDHLKPILKPSSSSESKYRSQYSSPVKGPNVSLRQGPKDTLLLEDYMAWTGPNPEFRSGQAVRAEGSARRDLGSPAPLARGPTVVPRGAAGLAKGSIYQKLNKKSAKIVV